MPLIPTRLRPWWGLLVGAALVGVATIVSIPIRDHGTRAAPALLLVVAPLVAALIGGLRSSLIVAAGAAFAFASAFLPPLGSPRVRAGEDVVALVVFLTVAVGVGMLVGAVVSAERKRLAADEQRIDALEELDRQRSAFLRGVSHDLRTPLSTIHAAASDLASGAPFTAEVRNDLLSLVIDEAERLNRMVANLLSLSRAESGMFQLRLEPTDLAELVRICADRSQRLARDMSLVVNTPHELVLVVGDALQLDQLVTNLIENAVRHSLPGSRVCVEVSRRDDAAFLTVSDDGPGVPAAVRAHLFEPFAPGPGSTSTGAGLATCKAIVDAHGGTITLDEGAGTGARFVITLPLHQGPDSRSRR